jgi:hypothetical protein
LSKGIQAISSAASEAIKTGSRAAVLRQAGAPLSWTNERAASLREQSDLKMGCWLRVREEGSG